MLSKYNFYYKDNNYIYILNLITMELTKINLILFENVINNKTKNQKIIDKFYKRKILIEGDVDELEKFMEYYELIVNSRSCLKLTILPTVQCNFKCIYCYEENGKTHDMNKLTATKILHEIENKIKNYNSIYIEWFGGEPLLKEELIIDFSHRIKNLCMNYKKAYLGSMTTNGYLLNIDILKKLVKENIRFFQITLDGEEKAHNKTRPLKNGKGSFDVIYRNLLTISKGCTSDLKFKITVRCNLYRGNIESIKKLKERFEKDFKGDKRFSLYVHYIEDWGGDSVKKLKENLFNPYEIMHQDFSEYNNINKTIGDRMCLSNFRYHFVIDPNGKTYYCSHFIDEKDPFYRENCKKGFWDEDIPEISVRGSGGRCRECEFFPYCFIETCPLIKLNPYENCKEVVKEKLKRKILDFIYEHKNIIDTD